MPWDWVGFSPLEVAAVLPSASSQQDGEFVLAQLKLALAPARLLSLHFSLTPGVPLHFLGSRRALPSSHSSQLSRERPQSYPTQSCAFSTPCSRSQIRQAPSADQLVKPRLICFAGRSHLNQMQTPDHQLPFLLQSPLEMPLTYINPHGSVCNLIALSAGIFSWEKGRRSPLSLC